MRSSLDPLGNSDCLEEHFIGEAYIKVRTVADNIDKVIMVADRDADVGTVAARDADIATVAARDEDIGDVATDLNLGTAGDESTIRKVATDLLLGGASKIAVIAADLYSGTSKLIVIGTDMLLGAGSKVLTLGTDLLLAGSSKVLAVGTDILLNATSKIKTVGTDLLLGVNSYVAAVGSDLLLGGASILKRVSDNVASIVTVATDLGLGGAASFILRAPQAAIDAAASAILAATNAGSGLRAYTSMTDLALGDTTMGTTPLTGTVFGSPGNLNRLPMTFNAVYRLKQFSVFVMNLGTGGTAGSLLLDVVLPYNNGAIAGLIGQVSITGIASTGLKTFTAGVDYPDNIWIIPGCELYVGSLNNGCLLATDVSIGNGVNVNSTYTGYAFSTAPGSNFIVHGQVVLSQYTKVSDAISKSVATAKAAGTDGTTLEYAGYEGLSFDDGSSGAGAALFDFNMTPTVSDGMFNGVQYSSLTPGDCWCLMVDATGAFVPGSLFKATLANGKKLFAAHPSPVPVPKGSRLGTISLTGWPTQRNVGVGIADGIPQTGALFSGMALTQAVAARSMVMRAVIERPKTAKEIARVENRQRTVTLNQNFAGVTLPSGLGVGQFTAGAAAFTCNNGLISPSSPTPSWTNTYLLNDATCAHVRTHHAEIVMGDAANIGGIAFKTPYNALAFDSMSTFVVIDGPAALARVYPFNENTSALLGAGLSVALPWTPTATDRIMITCQIDRDQCKVEFTLLNGTLGAAPLSCSISWTFALAPVIGGLMRGYFGAVFYSGPGGMQWKRLRSISHVAKQRGLKLWFGDSTHDIGGIFGYGRSWVRLVEAEYCHGSFMNCAKGSGTARTTLTQIAQDVLAVAGIEANFVGSIPNSSNVLTVTSVTGMPLIPGQVIFTPLLPYGTTITAQTSGATGGPGTYTISVVTGAGGAVSSRGFVSMSPTALLGVEVFNGNGVNVDNRNGGTDLQRYTALKTDHQSFNALVTALSGKYTVVTPTPGNAVTAPVDYSVTQLLAGDLGYDVEVIDVNSQRCAVGNHGTWIDINRTMVSPGLGKDGLHPDPVLETALIRDDFLRIRPDMRSSLN